MLGVGEKPNSLQVGTGPRSWSETMRVWTVPRALQRKVLVEPKATWKVMGALCRLMPRETNVGLKGMRPVPRVIKRAEVLRKD